MLPVVNRKFPPEFPPHPAKHPTLSCLRPENCWLFGVLLASGISTPVGRLHKLFASTHFADRIRTPVSAGPADRRRPARPLPTAAAHGPGPVWGGVIGSPRCSRISRIASPSLIKAMFRTTSVLPLFSFAAPSWRIVPRHFGQVSGKTS